MQTEKEASMDHCTVYPIGQVRKENSDIWIEVRAKYADGLLGLERYSHVYVLYWLHENDTAEKRSILQVHPRGNEKNPLTGAFAARSPVRPNPIALSRCRILSISENRICIDEIDALSGSPVLDIKGYIPYGDEPDVLVPRWI